MLEDEPHEKAVLIEFEDREEAVRWAESSEYREIATDREAATEAAVVLLSGRRLWTDS